MQSYNNIVSKVIRKSTKDEAVGLDNSNTNINNNINYNKKNPTSIIEQATLSNNLNKANINNKTESKLESDLSSYIIEQIDYLFGSGNLARELAFLCMYYGLSGPALTLEAIGQSQENKLTRERVRQIIEIVLGKMRNLKIKEINPYLLSKEKFSVFLKTKPNKFVRMDELVELDFFANFKKNHRGLIAFLNDCDVKQIAYRKKYYLYPSAEKREEIIKLIQKENKTIRRGVTVEKAAGKSKTVTYAPKAVRKHLKTYAKSKKVNLNNLYENILNDFIREAPYKIEKEYLFPKTKSWKARKRMVQWEQIGIYINKDTFEEIKKEVKHIKKNLKKSVSLMNFICQAFTWHSEKYPTA